MSDDALSLWVDTARAVFQRRNQKKLRIEWSSPSRGDKFAPANKKWPCRDRNGYRRRQHEYDRDERCVFCDHVKLWWEK